MRGKKLSGSIAILIALIMVTGISQTGSASIRPEHRAASSSAIAANCDPDDLPGGPEGPDGDGDECNFTVDGTAPLPTPPGNPDDKAASEGEFAQGTAAKAKKCNTIIYNLAEIDGTEAVGAMAVLGAPTGATWLAHFLNGSGAPIDLGDSSPLAGAVKKSSAFKALDAAVQAEAKRQLDGGQQSVTLDKAFLRQHQPSFTSGAPADPEWAFGGTQGIDVHANGFPQNGNYVGEITYTIRDVYGFYDKYEKFPIVGKEMHYLQGTCGAPYHKGGAHWFYDSVTVTVKFQQRIN
jgi:hypothetical protein